MCLVGYLLIPAGQDTRLVTTLSGEHRAVPAGFQIAHQIEMAADTSDTAQPPAPPSTAISPPAPAPVARTAAAAQQAVPPAAATCGSVIQAVEARGLYPAPGFVVICPGYALGHEGMTCLDVAGVCPGSAEIVIHYVQAFVVANEFENSRILSGAPSRCRTIDCGHSAYGF